MEIKFLVIGKYHYREAFSGELVKDMDVFSIHDSRIEAVLNRIRELNKMSGDELLFFENGLEVERIMYNNPSNRALPIFR